MDMPTQSSRSASFNRCHNAKLATIEVAGIGLAVGFAVAAEDIYRLFCQLLFTQAFLFKQLRLFERIAERAIVRAAVKVRPAIV
jgi:cytochrome c oxidase assembly protein Cox11